MKTPPPKIAFALSIAFGVCLTVSGFAQNPLTPPPTIRWETDINVALARAEQEQRPVFLHFIGNDCQPAQQMAQEVFVQPNIIAQLNTDYVMVKINATENATLAQKFSVAAIPCDLIIKPNGQLVHRRTGGITAERFTEYLAFLQKTLQQLSAGQVAAATPVAPAVHAAPIANPQATPPAAAVPEPQREAISVPIAAQDLFAQQSPSPAVTPAVGTIPPSSANPLREIESTSTPAPPVPAVNPPAVQPALNQTAIPAQASAHVAVPPPTVVAPAVSATTLPEERKLSKLTVEVPLALEGFCPVTLCTGERWVSGNPAYCTMYQGQLFRFATPEALITFAQNPAKYIPVAMGEDVVLMADRNKRVCGDRKFGAWFQDRVFLFANQETLNAFAARPEYYGEIAIKYELARKEQPSPIVY